MAATKTVSPVRAKAQVVKEIVAEKARSAIRAAPAPSPDPKTNLAIADIVLRGGGRILRHALELTVLGSVYDKGKATNLVRGRSMSQTLISTAIARIATRSLPGALLVGGGMLAKALLDHHKGRRQARREGNAEVAEQAENG